MIPRVAGIGSSPLPLPLVVSPRSVVRIPQTKQRAPRTNAKLALVLSRSAFALVLLTLPVAVLRAQEPQQWPQDETYDDTQSGPPQQPQYGLSQGYPQQDDPQQGYPQSTPQGYDQQPQYSQQPQYNPAQALNAEQLEQ